MRISSRTDGGVTSSMQFRSSLGLLLSRPTRFNVEQCWLLAILHFDTTPVMQSGVLRPIVERGRIVIVDTIPYLVLFVLFLLIWQTTMGVGVAESLSLHFTIAGLLGSLREGIWSSDLAQFYSWVASSPDRVAFIVSGIGCGVIAFLALQWRERGVATDASVIGLSQLIDVAIVFACIAAPTVALESSSAVWTPGTRWPMIYQLTTPALLLVVVACLLAFTSQPGLLRMRLWVGAVSVAIGLGVLLALGHNQQQLSLPAMKGSSVTVSCASCRKTLRWADRLRFRCFSCWMGPADGSGDRATCLAR